MTLDEFEALRLADLDGLYQEQAAERMGVSRATFGRILESAHRKVAEVLVGGRMLRIEGGTVVERGVGPRRCPQCASVWVGRCGCPRCRHKKAGESDDRSGCESDGTPCRRGWRKRGGAAVC